MSEQKHESIKKTVDEIYNSQVDSDFVYNNLIGLEDRSKRNNLRIYGISKSNMKHGRNMKKKFDKVFCEKLDLDNIHEKQLPEVFYKKRSS